MTSVGALMGLVLSVGGWLGFGIAATALLLWRHALATRAESVARACHELRGPLAAARLGLELSVARPAGSTARLRAIELELDRAAMALDDLQGVTRVGAERPLVDVESWLTASVEASWPVAARYDATVRLRWEAPPACVRGAAEAGSGDGQSDRQRHRTRRRPRRGDREREGRTRLRRSARCRAGIGPRAQEVARTRGGSALPILRVARREPVVAGAGRGLIIARTVATAHGGRLTPAPSDHGTTLVLELPLAQADGGHNVWRLRDA